MAALFASYSEDSIERRIERRQRAAAASWRDRGTADGRGPRVDRWWWRWQERRGGRNARADRWRRQYRIDTRYVRVVVSYLASCRAACRGIRPRISGFDRERKREIAGIIRVVRESRRVELCQVLER